MNLVDPRLAASLVCRIRCLALVWPFVLHLRPKPARLTRRAGVDWVGGLVPQRLLACLRQICGAIILPAPADEPEAGEPVGLSG